MAAVLFDTHEAIKELHDAGIATPAAEAVVRTFQRCLGETVATKADIAELRAKLKADIAELRAKLKADIAVLDNRLTQTEAEFKAHIAEQFRDLYKYLWLMAAGIVALNVTLTVTLIRALS